MASIADGSPRGLHLGWIPNDPGRRPREFPGRPPESPKPDPAKLRAVSEARHWSGMRRVLVFGGAFALALFGGLGALSHKGLFFAVAGGLGVVFWSAALASALAHRRALSALRLDEATRAERHVADLARHTQAVAAWQEAEADRVASAPRWLRVSAREEARRLDVFGGTPAGRQGMLAGIGASLLEQHAVIVLDLSQDRACEGLLASARAAGISAQDYRLPRDLRETPLLSGLSGEQVGSLIVEVLHADDGRSTTADRATDLMVLRKVIRVLGDAGVTMARLHAALLALLMPGTGDSAPPAAPLLTCAEAAALVAEFGAGFREQVAANLVRMAAIVEPLADLAADAAVRPPARLTCLSLADGPRGVAADLTAALVVQWATQAVIASGAGDGVPDGAAGPRPAIVLVGADEQAIRHLQRLTSACERHQVPLVRAFSRLTEESARHLDSRNTAFMRLATRAEAMRAAEHIGLERRFVAGRFSRSRSVSQSRTSTRGESVTHATGYAQGEAVTRTTGTTEGESLSETLVQRRGDHADGLRDPLRDAMGDARSGHENRDARGRDNSNMRPAGGRGAAFLKPAWVDYLSARTRTRIKLTHHSEAKTESWTRTEETSHTRTRAWSKTDGTSVGDETTYELTYDHKVAPETLMDLPADQMLAPHVVEGAASAALAGESPSAGRGLLESKMIALVIDPAVVGSDPVGHVEPHEIPVYVSPKGAVSPRRAAPPSGPPIPLHSSP